MKTREEIKKWLLENCVDDDGDLYLNGLDFSDFDGDVYLNFMKVKRSLAQSWQEVGENLVQMEQKVGGNLCQELQKVGGYLRQGNQKVGGDLIQSIQEVKGKIYQDNLSRRNRGGKVMKNIKVKLIKKWVEDDEIQFEKRINDFIKDKEVIDIKYSTGTQPDDGIILLTALVIYQDIETKDKNDNT